LGECGGERDEEGEAERGERAEFHHSVQGTGCWNRLLRSVICTRRRASRES
jgi:hypothetical protein